MVGDGRLGRLCASSGETCPGRTGQPGRRESPEGRPDRSQSVRSSEEGPVMGLERRERREVEA